MIVKPRLDLLSLPTAFNDVSVFCSDYSNARKNQIWFSGNAGVKPENKNVIFPIYPEGIEGVLGIRIRSFRVLEHLWPR